MKYCRILLSHDDNDRFKQSYINDHCRVLLQRNFYNLGSFFSDPEVLRKRAWFSFV